MVTIGNFKIDAKVFMAPMSGCTDLSFRLIAREHGAKLCFFEMVDSNSLVYSPKKDADILMTTKDDNPIAGQLVGPDPEMMLKAAKVLIKNTNIKFLDINAACPVKKIVKKKAGAYFLKEPKALYKIIKSFSSKLDLPITVKLRTGYLKMDIDNLVKIAKNCQKSGASAIFIHGRTQKQGYSGDIDYSAIKKVKQALNIPVFGSGNIMSPELAKKMMDETGCDGVIAARGALGNPWIFEDIEHYLKTGALPRPLSIETRVASLKRHLEYIDKYKSIHPSSKAGFMRKIALWYLKDFSGARRTRTMVNSVGTYGELVKLLGSIAEANPGIQPAAL
jgi:tRNA-dihydrouridine synthase B